MKRLVLKNWVSWLLMGIMVLAFILLGGECEDMSIFVISKVIAMVVMYVCYKLVDTYASSKFFKFFENVYNVG